MPFIAPPDEVGFVAPPSDIEGFSAPSDEVEQPLSLQGGLNLDQDPKLANWGTQTPREDVPLEDINKIIGGAGKARSETGKAMYHQAMGGAFLATGQPSEAFQESAAIPSEDTGLTPSEEGMRTLNTPSKMLASGARGLIESAPQMAAVIGAQAMGVPAPLAAGAVFGTTPQGFDPEQAAIGAALPAVGQYTGAITEALASKLGVSKPAALAILNKIGGAGGAASLLGADQVAHIAQLPPDKREDAFIDAAGNVASMAWLGMIGEHGTPETPSETTPAETETHNASQPAAKTSSPSAPVASPSPINNLGDLLDRHKQEIQDMLAKQQSFETPPDEAEVAPEKATLPNDNDVLQSQLENPPTPNENIPQQNQEPSAEDSAVPAATTEATPEAESPPSTVDTGEPEQLRQGGDEAALSDFDRFDQLKQQVGESVANGQFPPPDVLREMEDIKNRQPNKGYPPEKPVDQTVNNPPEPAIKSLGGKAPSDVGEIDKSNLAQLTDSIKAFAQDPKATPEKVFDFAKEASKVKDAVSSSIDGLRAAGELLKTRLEGKPVFYDFKKAIGDRYLALSESAINARKFSADATARFKDPVLREAISNYVDAGGDMDKLRQAATETKPRYKAGYERALNLSPDEKTVADNLANYFQARLADAQKAGILEDGIEHYIHRMYEKDTDFRRGILAELKSGIFTGKPALAKQRAFEYDLDAEKAGLKPVKSFITRTTAYDLALNKSIADRQAVKAMMEMKMPDGRPMIDVAGIGTPINNAAGETDATLIKPKWKLNDEDNPDSNRNDFKNFDYPALRKWKWVSQDSEGKPILVQGDVLIHPDAISKVKSLFERSAIRANPVGRAALKLSSAVKQTMLDLSGFHFVQIGVHGAEHRSFAPVKEIDFTNPDVRGLIRGGLVVGDTSGRELFDEGLSGSSLTKFIPVVGPKLAALKDFLFQSYIPRLKVATGLHALERNREAFPNLTDDEVHHLTANQMNAAFGELNYAMLGRSETMQDAMRLALLSPDFTEARTRFAAQAITKYGGRPTTNSKGNFVIGEQGKALLTGAAAFYTTARIMNQVISGNPQWDAEHAFEVLINGKWYSLRTVQGDIIHAATDFPGYVRNRLNPALTRPAFEAATGRDQFGRKRSFGHQVTDAAKTPIPISLKGLFSGREQSLAEALFNSFGVTEHRDSAAQDIYQKVQAWKDKNKIAQEPGEFIYDPDKDPYRQLKLAAQFYNPSAVKSEIQKLVADGTSIEQITKHFERYGSAPLAGSQANDQKFLATLSDSDKAKVEQVKAERAKIRGAVEAAME